MLDTLTDFMAGLSPGWLYAALFISAYLENVIPPVPGDTVTVFAAYLVGRTRADFLAVFASTTIGSTAGFMTFYVLGRLVHPEYFVRKDFRFLPATGIEKAGKWFRTYGYWVVLSNRFLSGIRSVISIVCGLYRLPWKRVLALAAAGCGIWNLLLIWAGYQLGANWRVVEQILNRYSRVLLAAGALAALLWLLQARRRANRNPA